MNKNIGPAGLAVATLGLFVESAQSAVDESEIAAVVPIATVRIDEIVVTARKRPEPQLVVPLSVSAFSAETIQNLGLTRLDEVARFTPGFSFDAATGRQLSSDRPNIRGLTTIRNGIANTSSAATFIDGVYVGGSVQSSALYNLERVEVVRGPQSVLYGRGTYAGAINYVTRKPGDELNGDVTLTVGEHSTYEATGWVGGPLANYNAGFYLAAGHREYGGEYRNTIDGRTVGGEQSDDVSAKIFWSPTDALEVSLQLAWQSTDDEHFASYLQPRELNNCCFRSADAPRAREYYVGKAVPGEQVTLATDLLAAAGGAGARLDRWRTALSVEWQSSGGYELRSLTGYIDDDLERGFDDSIAAYEPLSTLPGFFTKVEEIEQSDFSQELRLSSPVDQVLGWSLGAYYYRGELDDISSRRVYRDMDDLIVVAPSFSDLTREVIDNQALFGGVNWQVSDEWTTEFELRWARDKIKVTNRSNDAAQAVLAPSPFSETFNSLTPRFSLSYRDSETSNYYLSVAKGTKPGTFNSSVPDESFRAVDEETVWSYELGNKTQWTDRLSTASAVYYMDVDDQQLTQLVELPNGATASIIENIGRSEIWGLELDLSALLTDRLNLGFTYAYTHAEFREHISIEEADLNGSDGSLEQNLSLGNVAGNRLPRVPEHMASLVLNYEQPLDNGDIWYVTGDYSYESSKFAQEHNLIETGDRQLAGLRTGWRDERWNLGIWVSNLFDDDTPVDITRYLDTRSGTLPPFPQEGPGRVSSSPRGFIIGLPRGRQLGATLRYSF